MEPMYECPECTMWIRLTRSDCVCDPKREYDPKHLPTRQADTELSGNGAGLGVARPIPNTQGD